MSRFSHLLPLALACAAALSSCSEETPVAAFPKRDCTSAVWIQPERAGSSVGLTGSWNLWEGVTVPAERRSDGWALAYFILPPGEYGYMIVEDGESNLDPLNPLTTFRGEQEVSLLVVQDCSVPSVRVDSVAATNEGALEVRATFIAASEGEPLSPGSIHASTFSGLDLSVSGADPDTGRFTLRAGSLPRGKHSFTVEAADRNGRKAEPGRGVAWVKPAMETWNDGVLYHVLVDRYRGDGGAVLSPPPTSGSRAGGTLEGVRSAIESGELEDIGVTALWISPVYVNPLEAREGRGDGHLYEGYHGYWPLDSRGVEPRIGGEQALRDLVEAAHTRGMRVLLDVVPNHVYEDNPIYLAHRGDGWFHDGADECVCGDPGCGWDTNIESCWFTPYLPDYRWQHPDVMTHGVDETLWWTETYDIDGVRIDAVPMMPRATTRRIARALRTTVTPADSHFVLGEIYTGPGQGGISAVRYHLGPDGLDSAFDFPLLWVTRDAFARGTAGFDDVDRVLRDSDLAFEGAGAIIARILGNHDTTRFVSVANGDAEGDPWASPPPQPVDPEPYARHRMALAFVMTLPGLPLLYYGDEIALAGGSDPDCRRVYPAQEDLNAEQVEVLETARTLGQLRRCSDALRKGVRVTLQATDDTYAYARDAGDAWPVLVLLSKASTVVSIPVAGNIVPGGSYLDVLSGETISIGAAGADATVGVEPLSARVLISTSHPCR